MTKPDNFDELYKKVSLMRKKIVAPVDEHGCHTMNTDFQRLVAVILSSQTKDLVLKKVMNTLIEKGLSPKFLVEIPLEDLENLLTGITYHKKKAGMLKEMAPEVLKNGIATNLKDLMKLPGIGPKTGALYFEDGMVIPVDTHLHRIFNRFGWVKTQLAATTQFDMQKWYPMELRKDANRLFVGFGQMICSAKPKCDTCLCRDICPSSISKVPIDIEDFKSLIRDFS
jgi:endonuclease III